jgi:hypothetical protein
MALLTSIAFVISAVTVSYATYVSTRWDGDYLYWNAGNPGYTEHVIGNASEWIMVFSFLMVTVTFTKELGRGRLQISFVMEEASYEPLSVASKDTED